MPSRKPKGGDMAKIYKMRREPINENAKVTERESPKIYPDLSAEKENMDFSSSDDSPEKKYPYNLAPEKNASASPDSESKVDNVARHRRGKQQQKQKNIFKDSNARNIPLENRYSENSDVEMETDDLLDSKYIHPRQESSESPKIDKHDYSPKTNRRLFPQMQNETVHPPNYLFLIKCIIPVSIILVIGFCYLIPSGFPTSLNANSLPNATTLVNSLKAKFKNQPPITYRIIFTALKNVLHEEPNAPAIILLLATNGSEAICSDFALGLINSLSVPKTTVKISGQEYKEANAAEAKLVVDQAIKTGLKTNQLGSVLIYNLDHIPGQTAIILHKYYDHENAPFKKAVFVMTVNYNKSISDYSDTKEWDKAAYDHLLGVWTDSGVDQVTALLSRLTVSVAVIKNETL